MRLDRREREVCPALSHPPQKPPAGREGRREGGRPARLREGWSAERVSGRAATGNDTETSPGSNPNLAPDMKERGGNWGRLGGKRNFSPSLTSVKIC